MAKGNRTTSTPRRATAAKATVHYHREHVLISERASLCGAKPARLDAGADLAMVGAAGLLCARH
jgi:hypothetical protein